MIDKRLEKSRFNPDTLFEGIQFGSSSFDINIYKDINQSETFEALFHCYLDLKVQLANSEYLLPKIWVNFIDMAELLLNTIFACRAGNWDLLIECIRDIIPFAFAYDHMNYARYFTVMLGEMLASELSFPEFYRECSRGNLAAQLSEGVFNRLEKNKVIEMTLNKDTKAHGGTTGFSTSIGAVKRWEVNAAYRASLRYVFHEHLNFFSQSYNH